MGWIRYATITLMNALGVVIGIIWVPASPAFAQDSLQLETSPFQVETSLFESNFNLQFPETQVKSLEELYQLRETAISELNQIADTLNTLPQATWQSDLYQTRYQALAADLQALEDRIALEQDANRYWLQAAQFAITAVELGRHPAPSIETWKQAQDNWLQAINTLRQIPQESLLTERAIQKMIEYQSSLAIASYELQIVRSQGIQTKAQATTSPLSVPATTFSAPTATSNPPELKIYGDTNRDGVVNEADLVGKNQWSLTQGTLMLFNNNDNDGDGVQDWQDQLVNGEQDALNLAQVHLDFAENLENADVFLNVDATDRAYINVFQKTPRGWKPVDISGTEPLVWDQKIILGVEAKQFATPDWLGVVTLTAQLTQDGEEIATDSLQLGVVPWLLSPNTAPVQEVHVSERSGFNQEFIRQLQETVEKTGAKTQIVPGGTVWMQATQEIGYVQFPGKDGSRQLNVALNANRMNESDHYAKSLLGKDFGWFEIGKPRQLDPLNRWVDWYGNLAVTPPLPGYPLGRIYYGDSGTATLDPEIVEFLAAQKVQGPPLPIDTSWLLIRHVDEIISFIPTNSGEPKLLIVSPEAGVKLLQDLERKGYGAVTINRGLSTETTVKGALSNLMLIQHNQQLQRQHLNPLMQTLKQEFNLKESQIIPVPALFGYTGYSWWPNMVNALVVNGQLLVSSPRGALINGQDYTQENFRKILEGAGLEITFLDDQYYQELRGNTHSATNTTRQGETQPFWELLSDE